MEIKIKKMGYLFTLFFLIGCQNKSHDSNISKVDSLIKQNENLKKELAKTGSLKLEKNRQDSIINTKQYCYVLLTYINHEMGSGLEGLKDVKYLTWSDIIEVSNFNEENKYKLMDEFEKKFLQHPPAYFKMITKRECFAFDSYVDASKNLASKKSL
jgi:hypothetical protein